MSYKGRYTPANPKKYKGNSRNIVYRSLWERKFMVYCDTSKNILEWGSEEIIIPYISPVDGKIIGFVTETTSEEYEKIISCACSAFKRWRILPAPKRGEIVWQFGDKLR